MEEKKCETDSLNVGKNITDRKEMYLWVLSNKKLNPISEKTVYMP